MKQSSLLLSPVSWNRTSWNTLQAHRWHVPKSCLPQSYLTSVCSIPSHTVLLHVLWIPSTLSFLRALNSYSFFLLYIKMFLHNFILPVFHLRCNLKYFWHQEYMHHKMWDSCKSTSQPKEGYLVGVTFLIKSLPCYVDMTSSPIAYDFLMTVCVPSQDKNHSFCMLCFSLKQIISYCVHFSAVVYSLNIVFVCFDWWTFWTK